MGPDYASWGFGRRYSHEQEIDVAGTRDRQNVAKLLEALVVAERQERPDLGREEKFGARSRRAVHKCAHGDAHASLIVVRGAVVDAAPSQL